jgi:hypothetical protein
MSRAVISNQTLEVAEKSGIRPDAFLKNAAIAFDTIYFHLGAADDLRMNFTDIEMLAGWAGSTNGESMSLCNNRRFREMFVPAAEVFTELSDYNARQFLRAREHVSTRMLDGMADIAAQTYGVSVEQVRSGMIGNTWKNIPAFAVHDVLVLGQMRRVNSKIVGAFATAHVLLLASEIRSHGVTADPIGHLVLTDNLKDCPLFPDFTSMSWDEIFELREHAKIGQFRNKLQTISEKSLLYPRSNWTPLWKEYFRDLEILAQDVNPSIVQSGIIGALGSIPLEIPNPLSAIARGLSFLEQRDRNSRYGWLYFVQHAKSIPLRKPISDTSN